MELAEPPAEVASVPQTRYPSALVSMVSQLVRKVLREEPTERPPERVLVAAESEASTVLPMKRSALMPPTNVLVAVVVETMEPTVTCDDVAARRVPSNHRRPEERALALVPPFAIGRIPVTSAVNEINEFAIAPAVALRNPLILEMVRPPEVMLIPPLKVEVAVEEA